MGLKCDVNQEKCDVNQEKSIFHKVISNTN